MSLPSWERGLKCPYGTHMQEPVQSLPSWERGLKSVVKINLATSDPVAPFVGAWIEIQ